MKDLVPNGIWEQMENPRTGEKSLREHTPKRIMTGCANHYFTEEGGSRHLTCNKCGFGMSYVLGREKLVNGKLIKIKKKTIR